MPDFFEFFAGGGMVRAGLGPDWRCVFANDFDPKKSRVYRENWGDGELKTADIRTLSTKDLPGSIDLAWASFPCQDLSLAGVGAGLKGDRSGTFWPFWKLMEGLSAEQRAPRMIVLENVCGTLTSHEGKDFAAICSSIQKTGYSLGAVVIDAALFVPQSRPRLFIVCARNDMEIPKECVSDQPLSPWHDRVVAAHGNLPAKVRPDWVWWNLPQPPRRTVSFQDVIEKNPPDVRWFSKEETDRLIAKMSEINRQKLEKAKRAGARVVGGLYRRTRQDESGKRVQRAEIRFDNVSGCLRTPAGGSSRQILLEVNGSSVKARLISSRETARLMGLPDSYKLPANYNEAYHLTGDGVVVPVVRFLAEHLFEPILSASQRTTAAA
jgi:DNA (cytosine-5)-methyltransferase 1